MMRILTRLFKKTKIDKTPLNLSMPPYLQSSTELRIICDEYDIPWEHYNGTCQSATREQMLHKLYGKHDS